ncbi:MAG: hypothetical protein WBP40_05060 [Candidatus Moraniibacteriota bacterium]
MISDRKLSSKLKLKIGVFVPPPLESNDIKSIHSPGIGRVTKKIYARLQELLSGENSVYEIFPELSFRNAVITNNKVIFNGQDDLEIEKYFWYSEIDRKPNSFDFSVLKALAETVEVTRDPFKYERALDKYTAFSLLRKSGVPVSESILVDTRNIHLVSSIVNDWKMVLMKPRRGGFGKGVTLLDSFESVRDVVEYIQATAPQFIEGGFHLERFYENDIKLWTSVTIINGTIVYGYRKNEERFVSLGGGRMKVYDTDEIGGSVHLCEVSDLHKRVALDAYKALGIEVIGFDMIWHNGAPIIVDVNTFPGMYQDLFDEQGIDGGDLFYRMITKAV